MFSKIFNGSIMEYALDMDLEHTCRICLSQADTGQRLFSLFSSAIVDGFLVSIPEAISFCVDLEIVESTELPGKICQTCKSQMLSFYAFKHKCKRTEQILQETVSRKRSEHEETSPAKREEPEVEDVVVDEDEFGQAKQKSVEVEDDGEDNVMFEIAELVQCDTCEKMFDDEDELKQHVTLHYEEESVVPSVEDGEHQADDEVDTEVESQSQPPEIEQDEEFYEDVESLKDFPEECREESAGEVLPEVPLDTGSKKQFETLIETENVIEPMTCGICNAKFLDQTRFRKHKRAHEATAGVANFMKFYFCNCKKVYQRQDEFLLHVKNTDHIECTAENVAEESLSYICGICSEELVVGKLDDMKLHILSHQTVHSCPFRGCGCEYASLARLGVHIRQKHVEHSSHQCQHCGMDSFDSMTDLQQHLRLKCTAKKFPCHHCDKRFLTQRSLANHLKTIDKRFRCEECGKSFAQQGELKLHQRIHNGQRPYQCTVCGKSYKSASLRTAHMDSHIDGKTFQCQICNKQLQTRTCYRNHIKRHSEEKKHGCYECPKKFYTKYQAKIHMEKVHRPDKPTKGEGKSKKLT